MTPEEEVAQVKAKLGPNLDPASAQLFGMETQAGNARNTSAGPNSWANDQYDAFQGAWIPTNMNETQWQATVNAVQSWAADTDYRGIPSWQEVVNLYEWGTKNGISMTDKRSVAQYLAAKLPPDKQQQMPWASTGMNQTSFNDTVNSYKDQFTSLIGVQAADALFADPNSISAVARTVASGMTMQHAFDTLKQTNPDYQLGGKYGYVALGYTYDTYQKYKNDPSTRQQIISRFGSGAANSDEAYMESLRNPLIAPAGAGPKGVSQQGSQRVQSNQVGRSSIR